MGCESPGAEKHIEKAGPLLMLLVFSESSCCGVYAQKHHRGAGRKTASVQVVLCVTRMILWWLLSGCGALYATVSRLLRQEKVLVLQICVEGTCDVQNGNSISAVSATSTQ